MSLLPNPNTPTTYNGYTFSSAVETADVSIEPVLDPAGRTPMYNAWDVTLRDWIVAPPGGTTKALVEAARDKLSKQAGAFVHRDRLGDIVVNVGQRRDVLWGPIVKNLRFKGADTQKVEFTWRVKFHLPECPDARYALAPMAFTYTLDFDRDEGGHTTRTYVATVSVPATRATQQSRRLPDTADAYLEKITPPMVERFRRVRCDRALDPAKTTLTLTVVDVEMGDDPPPPGFTDFKADHSYDSEPGNLLVYVSTLNATYTAAPGGGKTGLDAVAHFLKLVRDRAAALAKVMQNAGEGLIPIQFSIREPEIGGQKKVARLSMSWKCNKVELRDLLSAQAFWRPVPGSDHKLWTQSMANVLGPRGHANLTFTPNEDAIVDLCGPGPVVTPGGRVGGDPPARPPGFAAPFPPPTPDQSWLVYQNSLRVEVDQGNVVLKTLPKDANSLKGAPVGSSGVSANQLSVKDMASGWFGRSTNYNPLAPIAEVLTGSGMTTGSKPGGTIVGGGVANPPKDTHVQQRTTPLVYVIMTGKAVRAGYEIACPQLTDVNGKKPTPCNRPGVEGFATCIIGNFGVPLVGARWVQRYVLTDLPDGPLPVAPNPLLNPQS